MDLAVQQLFRLLSLE